jgi:hypothetical protein
LACALVCMCIAPAVVVLVSFVVDTQLGSCCSYVGSAHSGALAIAHLRYRADTASIIAMHCLRLVTSMLHVLYS